MKEIIVVTGGSGFIGTNLIEDLLDKGYEVWNFDVKPPKIEERRNIWIELDLKNKEALHDQFNKIHPDYIVDLAARTDLDGKRIDDYNDNIEAVKNVLECANKLPMLRKVVITSSMLVCRVGHQPHDQKDYAPSTLYGESKVITEKLTWEADIKCDWAIIRPTSIWGPWFGVPYRNFFDMVMRHRYFHIGKKSCTKTYGYVGNAVYQIEAILFSDSKDRTDKVFYIGDYEPYPIEIWANEIAEQLGYRIIRVPYWIIKCAAIAGDMLKAMGISFPMTSFRLKNMTTDNIIDMSRTRLYAPVLPFDRKCGIVDTLDWMKKRGDNVT